MLVLANISMVDLITVCLITMACVVIMIAIIVISSRKPKKEAKENVKIELVERKEEPLSPVKPKEPVPVKPVPAPKPKTDIEAVLEKMESELTSNGTAKVHTFEEEQEEKAIISYRELLKVAGKLKEENAILDDDLEKVHPVSPPKPMDILTEEKPIREEVPKENATKKFHSSEFISPIYGKQSTSEITPYTERHKREETEKDFLSELKDLRKNLE